MTKTERYAEAYSHIQGLVQGERDLIAVMATVTSELHHAFDAFDWTGFYRVVAPGLLKVG